MNDVKKLTFKSRVQLVICFIELQGSFILLFFLKSNQVAVIRLARNPKQENYYPEVKTITISLRILPNVYFEFSVRELKQT